MSKSSRKFSELKEENLWKHSAFYMVFAGMQKLISVGLAPILTVILVPEEFAVLDTLILFNTLLVTIIVFGMDSATARFMYGKSGANQNLEALLGGFIVVFIASFLVGIGGWLMSSFNSEFGGVLYTSNFKIRFWFSLSVPLTATFNLLVNYFKWVGYLRLMFGCSVAFSVLHIAIGVAVWKILQAPFMNSYFIGQASSALICVLVGMKGIIWNFTLSRVRNLLLPMIRFGLPFIFVGMGQQGLFFLERLLASNNLTTAEIGYYAANFRYSLLFKLPLLGVITACGPICFAEFLGRGNDQVFLKMKLRLTRMFLCYSFIITIFMTVPLFLDRSFGLINFTQIGGLICVHLIDSFAGVFAATYDIQKKTVNKAFAFIGSGLMALICDWFLIAHVGINGLIVGNIISRLFLLILCMSFYNKNFPKHTVSWANIGVAVAWAVVVLILILISI